MNHIQDSDGVLYEHSADGVFTVKEECNDDDRDAAITDNTYHVYKEHLRGPFEVGSMTGYAQSQPQSVVYMHMDAPNVSATIPTIEPITHRRKEVTFPALNSPPVGEQQQTFELKNMLSKVLQKLESIDERLGSIEKRMKSTEASAKVDNNNGNAKNKNFAVNINKGATKLKFNLSVDVNDSNDDSNTREDSVLSESGLQSGDSGISTPIHKTTTSFTPIEQTVQDEHKEHMQLNHNYDVESSHLPQTSGSSLANEQRCHMDSLHNFGPLLSSYEKKPRMRYRQPCKSYIKKALSYYYTRQELATCRFRQTSLGTVKRPPLSPKRMSVILEEAERVYPDDYKKTEHSRGS